MKEARRHTAHLARRFTGIKNGAQLQFLVLCGLFYPRIPNPLCLFIDR